MKKNTGKSNDNRILGRRVARELSNEELAGKVAGGGTWTWTLLYPSDPGDPTWDSGGGGPVYV